MTQNTPSHSVQALREHIRKHVQEAHLCKTEGICDTVTDTTDHILALFSQHEIDQYEIGYAEGTDSGHNDIVSMLDTDTSDWQEAIEEYKKEVEQDIYEKVEKAIGEEEDLDVPDQGAAYYAGVMARNSFRNDLRTKLEALRKKV